MPKAHTRRPASVDGSSPGFTLIEILIVVGIIAVLAGLLSVTLVAARERGRQATCISNLKQIYAGLQMYKSDYDEQSWPVRLKLDQYLANMTFICPDAPLLIPTHAGQYVRRTTTSYANWNIMFDDPSVAAFLRKRMEERGAEYPIVFCRYHEGWGIMPVLRLDGSVDRRKVPRHMPMTGGSVPSSKHVLNSTDL